MTVGEAKAIEDLAKTLYETVESQQQQIYDIVVLLKQLSDVMAETIKETQNVGH